MADYPTASPTAYVVLVDGIGPMWRHWCANSGRLGGSNLTLPLGELCDRCGCEPPDTDGVNPSAEPQGEKR